MANQKWLVVVREQMSQRIQEMAQWGVNFRKTPATAGVGYLITVVGATFQTDLVFVGVAIIAGTGIVTTELIRRIEARFDVWRPRFEEE